MGFVSFLDYTRKRNIKERNGNFDSYLEISGTKETLTLIPLNLTATNCLLFDEIEINILPSQLEHDRPSRNKFFFLLDWTKVDSRANGSAYNENLTLYFMHP